LYGLIKINAVISIGLRKNVSPVKKKKKNLKALMKKEYAKRMILKVQRLGGPLTVAIKAKR